MIIFKDKNLEVSGDLEEVLYEYLELNKLLISEFYKAGYNYTYIKDFLCDVINTAITQESKKEVEDGRD